MPANINKILQTIRRGAGLDSKTLENGEEVDFQQDNQIEADVDSQEISLIESAGETYERPVSVCFAGVGTHGVNVVMNLKNQNEKNELVDFVGINSDGSSIKELEKYGFKDNIWLSAEESNTHLGAGGKLEVGKELGEKYYDQFKKRFKSKELILVVTGMGGGTGTGAAPLVAKAAREVQQGRNNTLTIGIASLPPGEEYGKREIALIGIEELKKHVDALVVIDQLNLLEVLDDENASVEQGNELVDLHFHVVLQSIMDTVTQYTMRNIDFADVCSTFKNCGDAIITTVEASSENVDCIKKELEKALNDKLLINHSDKIATRLTIYHFFEKEYSIKDHGEVVKEVKKLFNWTRTPEGFYKCDLKNPSENFEKVGTGLGDEYKGRTKVIIMAGGFQPISASRAQQHANPPVPPPPVQQAPVQPIAQTQRMPAATKLMPIATSTPITAPTPVSTPIQTQVLPIQQQQPAQPTQAAEPPATEQFTVGKLLDGGFSL